MDWERMHRPEYLELHYRRNGSYPTHFALFGEEHGYFCKYRPPLPLYYGAGTTFTLMW